MTTSESTTAAPLPASGSWRARLPAIHGWRAHPAVRSEGELTAGERAADRMRNGMGSWSFVLSALLFLAIWMAFNAVIGGRSFDPFPFILLNLVLSCLAALQGAILLIAAKRSDQIAAELAQHDYETDLKAKQLIEDMTASFTVMADQHAILHRQFGELSAAVRALMAAGQDGQAT